MNPHELQIDCRPGCGPPRCECESRNGFVRARDGACIHVSECATYRGFGSVTDPRQPLLSGAAVANPPASSGTALARPPAPSVPQPPGPAVGATQVAPSPFSEEGDSQFGAGAPSGGGGLIPPPSGASSGGNSQHRQTDTNTNCLRRARGNANRPSHGSGDKRSVRSRRSQSARASLVGDGRAQWTATFWVTHRDSAVWKRIHIRTARRFRSRPNSPWCASGRPNSSGSCVSSSSLLLRVCTTASDSQRSRTLPDFVPDLSPSLIFDYQVHSF